MLPASEPLRGEILPPDAGMVDVIVLRHPLRHERSIVNLPAGLSLAELLARAWPGRGSRPMLAYLGEDVVPAELWGRVRPKPGIVVTFRATMHGKGVLRALAFVAIAIAAIVVGPWIAGALFAAGTTAFLVTSALVSGAITIGGSLLVNALFPVAKKPSNNGALAPNEEAQRISSLQGSQNQARPFGSIPVVLGQHRISPPFAAKPYSELVGDDQYLRLLFCVGYGPLVIDEFRIGETPIESFSGVELEVRAGYDTDTPTALYPGQVDQQDLSIVLGYNELVKRMTEPDIDEFSVDIAAPQGIYIVDTTTGARNGLGVHVRVFYRRIDQGGFTQASELAFWRELGQARRGTSVSVPRGQYEIMLVRISPTIGTEDVAEQVVWTALRSIKRAQPISFPAPLALVAIRIRASDQLSGVVDTFNVRVRSQGLSYNGATGWVQSMSRNPADLFRKVLQSPPNSMPVHDDGIDIPTLERWWLFNNLNNFTYDSVVENATSVYERLVLICVAGRAVPTFRDGKWSVIWDEFDAPVVQHFTPRNSSGFSSERVYQRTPHGFRVKFVNAAKGYAADERIVYDDGYDAGNATLFESIDLDGITSSDLAWKHGRYHIAQARLRPEKYQIRVDWEHLRCTRGDRVLFAHDIIKVGLGYGRVKSVADNVVTVDDIVTMEVGKAYCIRFRLANGTSVLRQLVTTEGEVSALTLDGDGALPAPGDLFLFGETERESIVCRVFAIEHQDDLTARLTLVDDAPALINADRGVIPPFDSRISQPADPFTLPPKSVTAKEIIVQGGSGATTAVVRLSWQAPRLGRVRAFEAQWRDEQVGQGGEQGWSSAQTVAAPQQWIEIGGLLLGSYSFRVRSLFDDGTVSSWAVLPASAITGDLLAKPLPSVTRLRSVFVDGVRNLAWDEVRDWRGAVLYEIRKGSTWAGSFLIETVAHPPFAVLGDDTYWIAAVAKPISNLTVYSAAPASIVITGATLVGNVVVEFDEKATAWSGTTFGTVAVSGTDLRTGGAGDVLTIPDFLGTPSLLDYGGGGSGAYEIPNTHFVDVGRVVACAVTVELHASAIWSDQDILTEPDFLGIQDLLTAEAAREVEVFIEIALGENDPLDIYSTVDTYEPADVYSQNIQWGPWQRFSAGSYLARHFKFRLILNTLNPRAIAIVQQFKFRVDVPDRIDHLTNIAIPAEGLAITYRPDNAPADAPFHGGPNGAANPYVNVTILDGQDGVLELSDESKVGCTVRIKAGGIGVARTVNIDVQGY
ncbi:putative Tail fiber protein [Bosea sp. LC85]|uniref:host specificity factor TipJ family phage tail protein n=1 Tax=Bosea sp. LC85 TaxID=1502851 RepID=UPI0004E45E86|nr:host specificity factor TipJ family phage tail protein [Bosea sp. LC85]KFC73189.1 putative Tail fiber protein [Bosea sp. LC85]